MKSDFVKSIAKRYVILFVLLLALFVYVLARADISGSMFANIIATLVLLAIIPFAIIMLMNKRKK
ncbi:hypothetical protein JW707_01415 [Candidatus Woesearchaeota archaeon]|nr:hypothetical protein [Candidatus Woesearchaeota archaeon]